MVMSLSKTRPVYFSKHNVSEIALCHHLQVSPEIGTSSIYWAQMSRFYLKTERESNFRNVVLKNKREGVLRLRQDDG
jgi:hypothetical protein